MLPDAGAGQGALFEFSFYAHGPLSGSEDTPEAAAIRSPSTGCLDGGITSPDFALEFDGPISAMEFPFDVVAETEARSLVAPGIELGAGEDNPHVIRVRRPGPEPFAGVYSLGLAVDMTRQLPASYMIASDVPADVECTQTPEEPACAD